MLNYAIKPNPKDVPIYPYANTDYYLEITEGKFTGLHFNFGEIEVVGKGENKKLYFDYNLLFIPEGISLSSEIEKTIADVLQHFLEQRLKNSIEQ